jgi:putative ATP-dependent endonuclease of OLD family
VASSSTDEDGKRKIEVEYFAYKRNETIAAWSDNWPDLGPELKVFAAEIGITTGTHFRSAANKERLKQKIRDTHPEAIVYGNAEWTNDSIPFNNSLQQAIPKVIVIPAVKDASDESKYSKSGKSAFGELMKRLILPEIQAEQEYQNIISAIGALSDRIHSEDGITGIKLINTKLSNRLSRLINAKANIKFENPEIDTVISSGVGLRIMDGLHDTPIGLQGHGLQRTLIFSLLEMVAENDAIINEENSRTTVILYEEPELYLHPQMLRKLKSILKTISESDSWQIICSTHSPVFVNVADHPESLIILSRNNLGSIVINQLNENPFDQSQAGELERDALRAALDFHPTVCEVFFASKVILVEGDTEMAIFKHCNSLLQHCEVDINKALDCSIVSCGGKWTIPAIARLLRAYGILFKIVHDLDRQGKSSEEIAQLLPFHPYNANSRIQLVADQENIFINEDTLEDIWDGSKRDKPYGAIKAIESLINADAIPGRLQDLVRFVYADFLMEAVNP